MFTQAAASPKTIFTHADWGLCSIAFASISSFTHIPSIIDVLTQDEETAVALTAFTFLPGHDWQTFKDLIQDDTLAIEKKSSAAGPFWESELTFTLNGEDYEQRGIILRPLSRDQYIIIAKDASGNRRLIGSPQRGADFEYAFDTKSALNKCRFIYENENEPLYINIQN
jgi:hypothetical protein